MLSTCCIIFYVLLTYFLMLTRTFWLLSTLADVQSLAVTYKINKRHKYMLYHSDINGVIRDFFLTFLLREIFTISKKIIKTII